MTGNALVDAMYAGLLGVLGVGFLAELGVKWFLRSLLETTDDRD